MEIILSGGDCNDFVAVVVTAAAVANYHSTQVDFY